MRAPHGLRGAFRADVVTDFCERFDPGSTLWFGDPPKPHTVETMDVVLCEGVARATSAIQALAPKQAVPAAPVAPKTKQDYVDEVVAGAAKDYGALTGNAADDKKLLDWMVAHYQNVGL